MRLASLASLAMIVAVPAFAQTPCTHDLHTADRAANAARDNQIDARQDHRDAQRDAAVGDYSGSSTEQHDARVENRQAQRDSHVETNNVVRSENACD